jgi:Flp pilus assembly protein TadG
MSLKKTWNALKTRAKAFAGNRRGNVAMIFALTLLPMTLAAGAGVDLTRALVVRSRLAEALDAAGLAVGATQGLSTTQIQQLAQNYFNQNYTADSSYGVPAAITVTQGTGQVQLSTSVSMPTDLIRVADVLPGSSGKFDSINVGYTSTVVWGQTKLWVSLVLDNTGSMSETDKTGASKISALKTATTQLLTTLKAASATAGDVMVSIVPFSKDVNLGPSNYTQSWIDWSLYGTCNISGIIDQGTCQSTHGTWTSSGFGGFGGFGFGGSGSSGSCNISGKTSQTSCQNATGTWTSSTKKNWNGCITDRGTVSGPSTQNYDTNNTTPTSSDTASYFTAEQYSACPEQMMALGDNWTSLSSEVTGMVANGSTNQTIGLALGWQTLTQGAPFSPPALPAETQRFIILLSDGLNTQDRWYGNGSDQSSQVDTRMALACTNAKADKIVIYTIYVDLNGTQGNSTVLQNCATDSSKYFDLQTSGAIVTTLNSIAQQITQLRVSK